MIAGFGLRPHQLSRDRYLELIISLLNRTSFSFALEVEADLVLSQFQFIVFAISCSNAKKTNYHFKHYWRGGPREATGLIRNGFPQLILTYNSLLFRNHATS